MNASGFHGGMTPIVRSRMSRLLTRCFFIAVFTLASSHSAAKAGDQSECEHNYEDDVVIRRDGLEPLRGRIIVIDDAGVTIRADDLSPSRLVPWDRVRDVQAASSYPRLDERLAMAEELWRARSRLERGDAALAESIFERLFDQSRGRTNETALIIADGLLRCRLNRMANDLAVIPTLEVIRLRRAGVETDRYRMKPAVYDGEYQLCPAVPSVWMDSPRLARLESDLERYDAQGDEVVAAMAALYQQALRIMHDVESEPGRIFDEIRHARQHPGVRLMRDLVTLIDPDAEGADRRRSAESRLARLSDHDRPWIEAWHRYFSGLSLVSSDGDGRNERGIATLAHLPVHFTQSQPYLAGLAMHRIIMHLESSGRTEPAASIREELVRLLPLHPAVADCRPPQ
jgi:hypothetical protein